MVIRDDVLAEPSESLSFAISHSIALGRSTNVQKEQRVWHGTKSGREEGSTYNRRVSGSSLELARRAVLTCSHRYDPGLFSDAATWLLRGFERILLRRHDATAATCLLRLRRR